MIDPPTLPPRHGPRRRAIHDFANASKEVVYGPPEPVLGLGPPTGHDDIVLRKSQSFGRLVLD